MRKINKKTILIFIITLLISIILYINFLPEYYSMDTGKIIENGYKEYGIQYSLQDGRIFAFLIFYIAEIININIKNLVQILLIFALIISSINVLKIYDITLKCKKASNKNNFYSCVSICRRYQFSICSSWHIFF